MESVNDCAFRRACYELGAGFTFTEMVRPASISRRNRSTLNRIDTFDPATPTSVQLLGSGPDEIEDALRTIEELSASECPHWADGIHGVDINFGCPSFNVIRDGLGPALLSRVKQLREIFEVLSDWRARTRLQIGAIGAKIRLGLNADDERRGVFLRAVKLARESGLDYVAIHGRHARDESKTSKARWEPIRQAKEVAGAHMQILGNGDVFTREDAIAMLEQTGCDGVLVARGVLKTAGYIFEPGWQGDDASVVEAADRLEHRHAELAETFGGPRAKIAEYHREMYRRIRARGSRKRMRDRWEALAAWLAQGCKAEAGSSEASDSHGEEAVLASEAGWAPPAPDAERLAEFFSPAVRISYSCLSPMTDKVHSGLEGAAEFLPLLARSLHGSKLEVHVPMEEAERDPRQIFVGLSNACTVTFLYDEDYRIARLVLLCAGEGCGSSRERTETGAAWDAEGMG